MRISARVDYAVRAMAELALTGSEPRKAEQIALSQDIPLKYLLGIFADLKRSHLVRGHRGPEGGYTLSRAADDITLADVFRAVDGPLADIHDQSLSTISYPGAASALPEVWMAVRASLRRALESVSVAELARGELPEAVQELAEEYRSATASRRAAAAGS
jgi:Rrf2 family protein